jgi:hypothetical protein
MGIFDHLQRKHPLDSTPALPAPSLLRPSRQFAPLLSSEQDAPVTQAQIGYGTPPQFSFDRIPIFPPATKNNTGLPDALKAGVESVSGMAMDDVHVNYNSAKPAQVQAQAYTQGTEIYVGPGQEQYLPHEAWHVVQQQQGRVKPTLQARGVAMNDDHELEREADMMEERASQARGEHTQSRAFSTSNAVSANSPLAHFSARPVSAHVSDGVIQAVNYYLQETSQKAPSL